MAGSPIAPQRMSAAVGKATILVHQALRAGKVTVGTAWVQRAACQGMDTNRVFYAPPDHNISASYYKRAYRTCGRCMVAGECLAEALLEERNASQHMVFGVRGGLTPRERLRVAIDIGLRMRAPGLKAG